MDWKKLHTDFYRFSEVLGTAVIEAETVAISKKLTVYQMEEPNGLYYQLKHAKPLSDYGSKLQLFSRAGHDLTITCKTSLFGKSKLQMSVETPTAALEQIEHLAETLSNFKWTVTTEHLGWPHNLRGQKLLKFESRQIDIATTQLDLIRQIHRRLATTI